MKLAIVGTLWLTNCICWLLLGTSLYTDDLPIFLACGVVALGATVALSKIVFIKPERRRRSQFNPERFELTIPPLYQR